MNTRNFRLFVCLFFLFGILGDVTIMNFFRFLSSVHRQSADHSPSRRIEGTTSCPRLLFVSDLELYNDNSATPSNIRKK